MKPVPLLWADDVHALGDQTIEEAGGQALRLTFTNTAASPTIPSAGNLKLVIGTDDGVNVEIDDASKFAVSGTTITADLASGDTAELVPAGYTWQLWDMAGSAERVVAKGPWPMQVGLPWAPQAGAALSILRTRRLVNTPTSPALTGSVNNYEPGTGLLQRWAADAAVNVTGLKAGNNGELKEIWNVGGETITLKHQSGSSQAANRFDSLSGSDVSLAAGAMVVLRYFGTGTSGRWQIATNATGGGDASTLNGEDGDFYRDRANHTGSQAISTVTNLQTTLDLKADLVAGKIPTAQIPAVALTEFLGSVVDQTAMLALIGQRGDWCVRTDASKVYILTTDDPTQAGNWQAIVYPTAPVTSVNGLTGVVVIAASDVGAVPTSRTITVNGTTQDLSANRTFTISTITGNAGTATALETARTINGTSFDGTGNIVIGAIPQNSQSAAYTTVLADAGKHLLHPAADTTARNWTIDSNANVAYPVGTTITFVNQHGAGVITIKITSDTMRLAGTGTTGDRTLAADGVATALKITSTEWIISGSGLT